MAICVVLDTSVLVAALRSRWGASYRILRLLRDGRYQIALSVPLALEYEAVLARQAGALGLKHGDVSALIDFLCSIARLQEIHFLWRPSLLDPRDEFILELAIAAGCQAIVTHNVRHFAGAERFAMKVLNPNQFLRLLEAGP